MCGSEFGLGCPWAIMLAPLTEAEHEAANSASLLRETMARRLNDRIDENSLMTKEVAENNRKLERLIAQKNGQPELPPDTFLADTDNDFLSELAQVMGGNQPTQSKQNVISAEIMEELVFETLHPKLETLQNLEGLKVISSRSRARMDGSNSLYTKVEALCDHILAEHAIHNDANFAFLVNEGDLHFGALTLKVRSPGAQLPASRDSAPDRHPLFRS